MTCIIKEYKKNIINYDLLNKYVYKNIKEIPCVYTIKLRFTTKKYDLKTVLSGLIALEILNGKKCKILKTKKTIISLKTRKGHPMGCSITLTGKNKDRFLFFLIDKVKKVNYSTTLLSTGFIINGKISNLLILPEFENNYNFFKTLKVLTFSIYTNIKSRKELYFLLNSYKI